MSGQACHKQRSQRPGTGSKADKESIFRKDAICDESFGIIIDIDGQPVTVERSGKAASKIFLEGDSFANGKARISNSEWIELLGEKFFGLHNLPANEGRAPSFRSLFAYFVRRQGNGAFSTPEKQATMQQAGDFQVALLYLLGLDWQIASEWQNVRDREKTLAELKKAAGDGAFGSIIGKASELRTKVTVAESRLKEMREQLANFRILHEYNELESEANQLTIQINELSNANVIDSASIRDLKIALESEAPPKLDALEAIYAEAGIVLPELAAKRYDEVRAFHESVIHNRRDYLAGELEAAKQRVETRNSEKQRRDARRSEIMQLLNSHGALDQYSKLQAETSRREVEVESLRQQFAAAEQLEGTKKDEL